MEEELKKNKHIIYNLSLAFEDYELHNNINDEEYDKLVEKTNNFMKNTNKIDLADIYNISKEIIEEHMRYIKKIGEEKFTIFENGEIYYNWGLTSTQYKIKIILNVLNKDIKKDKFKSVKEVISSLINDLKNLYDNNVSLDLIENIKKNIIILKKYDEEFDDLYYYYESIYKECKKLLYNL